MNTKELKYGTRNSKMLLGEAYFWTDTIKDWRTLLDNDTYKSIIMECWRELVTRNKIIIYGFVIMPNHLHILWEMMNINGKEMPYASFNKFTSHQFLDTLRKKSPEEIVSYKEIDSETKASILAARCISYTNGFKRKGGAEVGLHSFESTSRKMEFS
jgi:putative transposase